MCEVLEVSRSGFYAWRSRPESHRSKHHRDLLREIRIIHADRDMQSYGSPRVHKELVARGKVCSEKHGGGVDAAAWLGSHEPGGDTESRPIRHIRFPWRKTCSIGSLSRMLRIGFGWQTSPTSGHWRVGSTWPLCWMPTRGKSSAGR